MPRNGSGNRWPAEREALLRELLTEGKLRTTPIARLLGISRSAVIGKASRLGLPLPMSGTESARHGGRITAHKRRREKLAARPPGERKNALVAMVPDMTVFERIAEQPDVARVTTIDDLEPHHCRYPIGDGTIGYCGADKVQGLSYCATHVKRCYEPAEKQRPIAVYFGLSTRVPVLT